MCAQHYIRVGAVVRIEKRIAPDRNPRIGFGDLTELHPDVSRRSNIAPFTSQIIGMARSA